MDGDQDDPGLLEEGKEEENRSDDDEFKRPALISPILSKPESDDLPERPQATIPEPLTSLSPPEGIFSIEVIKNGTVIQNKAIDQSRITFGRSRDADFPMDHPSVSRFHSCLLWNPNDGPDGSFFLIDLNSVHGTFLNKDRIEPNKPYKLSGNAVVKIGGSSRLFFLSTSRKSEENPPDEMIDATEKESNIKPKIKSKEDEDEGCTWGMRDDFYQEDDQAPSEFTPLGTVLSLLQTGVGSAPTKNEHAYVGNPQKTMQTWFDSEGYEFEYKVDFVNGKFKCTLNLPIDDQDVPLESEMALKKKDAIHAVCLRACQILDKAELLFLWQRSKDSRKRKDDSSDSDGDLIDETDQYKQKKAKKDAAKRGGDHAESYESLSEKWAEISKELMGLKVKLANFNVQGKKIIKKEDESDKDDALDTFMKEIVEPNRTTKTPLEVKVQKSKMRLQIASLELEQKKIEKLMDIAKPSAKLPDLRPSYRESTKILHDRIKQQSSLQSKSSLTEKEVKKITPFAIEKDTKKTDGKETPSEESANPIEDKNDVSDFKARIEIQIQKKKLKPIGGAASVFSSPGEEEADLEKPKMTPLPIKKDKQYGLILKKDYSEGANLQTISKSVSSVSTEKDEDYVEWLPPANQTGDDSVWMLSQSSLQARGKKLRTFDQNGYLTLPVVMNELKAKSSNS